MSRCQVQICCLFWFCFNYQFKPPVLDFFVIFNPLRTPLFEVVFSFFFEISSISVFHTHSFVCVWVLPKPPTWQRRLKTPPPPPGHRDPHHGGGEEIHQTQFISEDELLSQDATRGSYSTPLVYERTHPDHPRRFYDFLPLSSVPAD